MKQIFVRPARDEDLKTLVLWSGQNPVFDPTIFTYPTTFTLAAFSETGVVAYLPVQQPFAMEAMCFHPLATEAQKALAMKELTHVLITQSYVRGVGEIIFSGSNNGTNFFAEHQGFQRTDWPTFRVRVRDLEGGGRNGQTS